MSADKRATRAEAVAKGAGVHVGGRDAGVLRQRHGDAGRLARLGVSLSEIQALIADQNQAVQAGHLTVGDKYIRIDPAGKLASLDELGDLLVVRSDSATRPSVRLRDNGRLREYAAVRILGQYLWDVRVSNFGDGWRLEPIPKAARKAFEALGLTPPTKAIPNLPMG